VDIVALDADPLRQLAAWLDAARSAGAPMPEAMTVATATADGIPSARVVILRGLQPGLVFFTDLTSDKGAELAANPQAAAVLHWLVPVHRQVRVTGPVEPVSEEEASEYWRTRPPATRGNAAASHQSSVIADLAALRTRAQDLQLTPDLPRPRRWGGFRVLPSRVEFWQESPDGLHDRIRYRRAGNNWTTERLAPLHHSRHSMSLSSRQAEGILRLPRWIRALRWIRCAGKTGRPQRRGPPVHLPLHGGPA
jgi:pyridoxamine 5'-phosphate oxidase